MTQAGRPSRRKGAKADAGSVSVTQKQMWGDIETEFLERNLTAYCGILRLRKARKPEQPHAHTNSVKEAGNDTAVVQAIRTKFVPGASSDSVRVCCAHFSPGRMCSAQGSSNNHPINNHV